MILKFKKFKFPYYNCFSNPTVWLTVVQFIIVKLFSSCSYSLQKYGSHYWYAILCESKKVSQYGDGGKNFLTTLRVSLHDPDPSKMET